MKRHASQIKFTDRARSDFSRILEYTRREFGVKQAQRYEALLRESIHLLQQGPEPVESKARDDIFPQLRTLHIMRAGKAGRHIIFYRPLQDRVIEILCILHDSMDFIRHLPKKFDV